MKVTEFIQLSTPWSGEDGTIKAVAGKLHGLLGGHQESRNHSGNEKLGTETNPIKEYGSLPYNT